jgi:hypothetical protein
VAFEQSTCPFHFSRPRFPHQQSSTKPITNRKPGSQAPNPKSISEHGCHHVPKIGLGQVLCLRSLPHTGRHLRDVARTKETFQGSPVLVSTLLCLEGLLGPRRKNCPWYSLPGIISWGSRNLNQSCPSPDGPKIGGGAPRCLFNLL